MSTTKTTEEPGAAAGAAVSGPVLAGGGGKKDKAPPGVSVCCGCAPQGVCAHLHFPTHLQPEKALETFVKQQRGQLVPKEERVDATYVVKALESYKRANAGANIIQDIKGGGPYQLPQTVVAKTVAARVQNGDLKDATNEKVVDVINALCVNPSTRDWKTQTPAYAAAINKHVAALEAINAADEGAKKKEKEATAQRRAVAAAAKAANDAIKKTITDREKAVDTREAKLRQRLRFDASLQKAFDAYLAALASDDANMAAAARVAANELANRYEATRSDSGGNVHQRLLQLIHLIQQGGDPAETTAARAALAKAKEELTKLYEKHPDLAPRGRVKERALKMAAKFKTEQGKRGEADDDVMQVEAIAATRTLTELADQLPQGYARRLAGTFRGRTARGMAASATAHLLANPGPKAVTPEVVQTLVPFALGKRRRPDDEDKEDKRRRADEDKDTTAAPPTKKAKPAPAQSAAPAPAAPAAPAAVPAASVPAAVPAASTADSSAGSDDGSAEGAASAAAPASAHSDSASASAGDDEAPPAATQPADDPMDFSLSDSSDDEADE
jgi:hypothetical protein